MVKKSVSMASRMTPGPETGLGTMTSLTWAMNSGGGGEVKKSNSHAGVSFQTQIRIRDACWTCRCF